MYLGVAAAYFLCGRKKCQSEAPGGVPDAACSCDRELQQIRNAYFTSGRAWSGVLDSVRRARGFLSREAEEGVEVSTQIFLTARLSQEPSHSTSVHMKRVKFSNSEGDTATLHGERK